MAMARQVPTPILEGKIEKSGRRGRLGWGQKVVGHMPWGALSGSPRVLGQERVFWGRCGGFRAPVVQYLQYMQILMRCVRIHTDTYKYLHIHTYGRQQNTDGGNILKDTNRFLRIHTESGAETGAVCAGIFAKIQQDSDKYSSRYL